MKLKRIMAIVIAFAMVFSMMSFSAFAEGTYVAKVGDTKYATIDEALAAWTNGTTLTLLSDVTLSDVIQLSSTEYHILDLGTYTMIAASGKDAIQYVVNGRSSAGYALDIKADASNPGGITATGKTIVSHIKPSSGAPSKDRPITRFYGGIFNASYVVKQGGTSNWGFLSSGYTGASAPYFQFYGGEYNGTIYTNRSQNQFYGGIFNGSMQMSVDSSAYTLVAGGTFKNLSNSMGSTLNSDKFVIGTKMGANNGSVCIDENGYYVISTTTPTEAEASVVSSYSSNNYFYYSTVNTNGMYYEDVYDALEANTTGTVTVFTDELDLTDSSFTGTIVVPEGETITIIVEEGTTPTWTIESAEAAVTYTDTEGNELVTGDDGSFAPVDSDAGVTVDGIDIEITPVDGIENSYEITLAEGATWTEGTSVTMTFPAVEGASDGDSAYIIHEHEDGTYIYVGEVEDGSVTIENTTGFSTFTVYDGDFADALTAANACTGDVTVEIYGEVEFVDGMELNGSYTSITFNGAADGATITINQTAGGDYLEAHGKTVAFTDLTLAKANPAWSGNSGHMGNYFSVQGGTVTYTNCTFPNGACTSGGTATYTNCTFQNSSEYGLWVYDDALVTVNGGTIDSTKGIKVYSEGEDSVTSTLTVEGATFTENVTAKPAVAVGYAESITLIGNTYNNSTAIIELDSGSDADCNGIELVAEDAEGNDISSTLTVVDRSNSSAACGVLVEGKIYVTVTDAVAVAEAGDTVTLLYSTTEEAEFAEGVNLTLADGVVADNVTVKTTITTISTVEDFIAFANAVNSGDDYAGKTVTLTADLTLTDAWTSIGNGSRSGSSYTGNSFAGTFDGGNYTIEGLTAPLFGIVTGTVKDVNLVADINDTTNDSVGAAVAVLVGGTVDDVDVSGTVIAAKAAGGVVGRVLAIGEVKNCDNTAAVTSTGSSDAAGGIVGKAYYTSTSGVMNVTNCTNTGAINGGYAVGGIAGFSAANVSNCANSGTVTSTGIEAGGIVGEQTNYGTVSGNENSANVTGGIAGGIVGWVRYQNNSTAYPLTETVVISNNTNTGSIASGTDISSLSCAGGIVGNVYNQATVTGNTNKATTISAATFAAGIVGALQPTSDNVDIDGATFIVTGNTTTTTAANITANCTDLVAYNNVGSDATIENNIFPVDVAQIGDVKYTSLTEAAAAAVSGDEIVVLADVTEDVTVPAGIIFNGNGKQVGTITAAGEITFKGHTKATNFGTQYTNTTINIGEGACLEITGTSRLVIGHGCTFNITGSITDAKTANTEELTASLIAPGASLTGAGVNLDVTNAYVKFTAYCSSKNSSASGTFNINVTNSIWEQTGSLVFSEPTNSKDPTFNFNLKDSVLNSTSHLVFAVTKGEIVFDNSNVNVDTSRQIENRSTMTIKNGSVVNGAVATSSNAKNPGTLIIENATYSVTGEFSGSDVGTGTIVIMDGASFTAGKITNANIQIDATNMSAGDVINLTANLSGLTGTVEVINNDKLEANIVDGKIVLSAKPVAQNGDVKYADLQSAIGDADDGDTVTLLADVELDAPVTIKKSITIDGNGHNITQSAECNNNIALMYFEGTADNVLNVTVKNTTFDGLKAGAAIRTLYANINVDNCVFQNCEHTVGQGLVRLTYGTANITNSKFLNNNCSMGISFNWDGNGLATDTLTIDNCEFTGNTANKTALVYYVKGAGCEIKNSEFTDNKVNCKDNGAVIYLGFQENCAVTGNLFEGNVVTEAGTSTRVAGAVFFGYEANISGNAFINNTATNANGDALGQVCTSTYYECEIDLSGNYWGGDAPVYGKDYTVQHQTGDAEFALDTYNASYEVNADGGVTVGDETAITNVAQVGKFGYATLQATIDAAQNSDTVTLLSDIDLGTDRAVVKGKEITIDLNGHNITGLGNRVLFVDLNANENKDGKITLTGNGLVENTNGGYAVYVGGNSELIVETGATVKSADGYSVGMFPMGAGRVSKLTVNGGIVSGKYGVSGNGLITDTSTVVTVNSGAIIGTEVGIYQPQPGTVNVNGGTVSGTEAAIAMRRGNANITGGTVEGIIDVLGDYDAVNVAITGGDFTNSTLKYAEGNTVTKADSVTLAAPEGYMWNVEGRLVEEVYVAQVGDVKYTTVLEALKAAVDGGASELKILADSREKMTTDFDIKISADLVITAEKPVNVEFYNEGTTYDFAIGSTNNNKLTIAENVHFDHTDRVIWAGYWGNNVDIQVDGYLGGYQIWHGADTTVSATGTLDSHGEAMIMRRDAIMTVNGGKVNANYIQAYSGHIVAKDAQITAGLVWLQNNHSYGSEGTISIALDGTEFTSNGVFTATAGEGKTLEVTLANGSVIAAKGTVTIGAGATFTADATSDVTSNNKSIFVAKADGIKYASLAEAIAAAQDSDTVTLLSDIELAQTITVANGKKITLDLNGKTISQEKACSESYQMINNKGNLTITGEGKISFKDTGAGDPNFGWGSYTIRNEGTLVVENGTIEHLGEQNVTGQSVKHMYCAIFQYSGSSTINGGVISTPTYRSVRLWKGDMTINDGTFDGQLWVQCVDDTSNLTINGGSFGPNGNDGSSVFIGNVTTTGTVHTAEMNVTGGTFATKIGANNVDAITGQKIIGGTYTETAVNGTNAGLLAEGYEFVQNDEGTYSVTEKAEVELFEMFRRNMVLGNSLAINIYYNAEDITDSESYVVVEQHMEDEVKETKINIADCEQRNVEGINCYVVSYTGVAACEMSDDLVFTVYNSNEEKISEPYTTSIRSYAKAYLDFCSTQSGSEKWMKTFVDMLNYGAAAQNTFEYKEEDLANSDIDIYQEYASEDVEVAKDFECSESGRAATSLFLRNRVELNAYFTNVTEDMYIEIEYVNYYGETKKETIQYADFVTNGEYRGATVSSLAIADAASPVKATLYSADGTEQAWLKESVNGYLYRIMQVDNDELYPALAKFAKSAAESLN